MGKMDHLGIMVYGLKNETSEIVRLIFHWSCAIHSIVLSCCSTLAFKRIKNLHIKAPTDIVLTSNFFFVHLQKIAVGEPEERQATTSE